MVGTALAAVAVAVAGSGTAFGLLAVLFRAQVRRFNRLAATEVLNSWATDRHGDPPPAEVLAAMAALPAPGWRSSWNEAPVSGLTGRGS